MAFVSCHSFFEKFLKYECSVASESSVIGPNNSTEISQQYDRYVFHKLCIS